MKIAEQLDRTPPAPGTLLKEQVADRLRSEIIGGRLAPRQRVVEGKWAREFGVAQASVREAINILIGEGFLTKDSGRSARVTRYSEHDVAGMYQVRSVLEGLAARLVTQRKIGVDAVEMELTGMEAAIGRGDMQAVLRHDLDYHLKLTELSGNPFLHEAAKRLLVPLFAFILLRVVKSGQGPDAWAADLPRHRRILDLIGEGDPEIAEQYVRRSYKQFVSSAYAVWENVGGAVAAHKEGRAAKAKRRLAPAPREER
jgi:DNA-binding GntR family transcriptional regulator